MKQSLSKAVLAALSVTAVAFSAPITVVYQGSFLEGAPGVDQGLPVPLSQSPNNVRFKFFVPDFASLTSINSLTASVDITDPQPNGFEQGALVFVLNTLGLAPVVMDSFSGGVPLTLSGSLGGGDLANALQVIQDDGIFFIRANRDGNNRQGNDFLVGNPIVTIDGTLAAAVPEPATLLPVAGGLLALAFARKRRFRG